MEVDATHEGGTLKAINNGADISGMNDTAAGTKSKPVLTVALSMPEHMPAMGAGAFQLARVEDAVELLVASLPLLAMAQAMADRTGDSHLDASVIGRYQMSVSGFLRLRDQVNELFAMIPDDVISRAEKARLK